MAKSEAGGVRSLFLLVLVGFGVWWYWNRWRPHHDYRSLSGRLETAVNRELVVAGVRDSDMARLVHKERALGGLVWVETDRRIEVSDPAVLPRLVRRLIIAATKNGCTVSQRKSPRQWTLEFRKGPLLLQRLVLASEMPRPATFIPPMAPSVALVIDDVAYDLSLMDRFASLGVPLTFAVLPRDKNSRALAEKARRLHFSVILHLPMEPLDLAHHNPGSAALYLKMTPQQLRQQFEKDVASVPYIQGINNHMGSAFTSDESKMSLVMKWVKEKNLFFLDSRTSPHSVVPRVALREGVPCLVNETFLDNQDDSQVIERQLDQVLQLALKRKRTIAIGHYRRKHLVEALAKKIPEFQARGVSWVTLPTFYPR